MTYLLVTLADGEVFTASPAPGQTVGWIAVDRGVAVLDGDVRAGDLAVLEPGEGPVRVVARGETTFVMGLAVPHPHELALGRYSVHTNAEALREGEAEIRRVRPGA